MGDQARVESDPLMESLPTSPPPPLVSSRRFTRHYGLLQHEFDAKYDRKPAQNRTFASVLRDQFRCTRQSACAFVLRRVPIIAVAQKYRLREYLLGDVVAGLSLGVMTIPQSLGYALLASVPAVMGLYTSLFPPLFYFVFATSRHVSIGTMALASLVIGNAVNRGMAASAAIAVAAPTTFGPMGNQSAVAESTLSEGDERVRIAVSVTFLAGLILVAMSVCRLGFIVTYMSEAFISGFLASSNLRVLTHQAALILYDRPVDRSAIPVVGEYFYFLFDILCNLGNTNLIQLLISALTIVTLIGVKMGINERFKHRLKAPIPIDLIAIAVVTVASHFLRLAELHAVRVLGPVRQGLPPPILPSPAHMVANVFDAAMLAVIAYMMVAMMARLFADRHGYEVDCNQELLANGVSCIGGAFFGSIACRYTDDGVVLCVCSTSPPRCFLMESTGGRTQLSHLVSALVVLLAILFIAPWFHSMPVCVLACVIFTACIPLLPHYAGWLRYARTDTHDLAIWCVTFVVNLVFTVDLGLVIGIAFSMFVVHFRMQRPNAAVLVVSGSKTDMSERKNGGNTVSLDRDENAGVPETPSAGLVLDYDDDFLFLDKDLYLVSTAAQKDYVVFRFESPLYFATLDVFQEQLFSRALSLPRLKQAAAKKARMEASVAKGNEVDVEVGKVPEDSERKTQNRPEASSGVELELVENKLGYPSTSSSLNKGAVKDGPCAGSVSNVVTEELMLGQRPTELRDVSVANGKTECSDKPEACVLLGKPFSGESLSTGAGAADHTKEINAAAKPLNLNESFVRNVIVDCSGMSFMDTGGARLLGGLQGAYARVGVRLVLAGCCRDTLQRLGQVNECKTLVAEALYPSVQDAVIVLTR